VEDVLIKWILISVFVKLDIAEWTVRTVCKTMPEYIVKLIYFSTFCSHVFSTISIDINDCAKGPCKNGGRCVDKVNFYQCICKVGYKGLNCENGMWDNAWECIVHELIYFLHSLFARVFIFSRHWWLCKETMSKWWKMCW
jgi:hypothetical protein